MKVIAARTHPFQAPQAFPANGSGCVVALETNRGLVGIGIGRPETAQSALRIAEDLLLGEDPRAVVAHWERMCNYLRQSDCRERDIQAVAMLDLALWDLKAKANHEPLWQTLGGARPRAFACMCVAAPATDDESFRDQLSSTIKSHGVRAGKLQLTSEPAVDMQHLEIMHKALAQNTPTPNLLIATDERWSPEQVVSRVTEIEQRFDLVCVQVSPSSWSAKGLKQLSKQVLAAVCVKDRANSAQGLFTSLDHNDFDILTIDPAISGISGSLQMAEAAFGYELPVTVAAHAASIGVVLAAVMPAVMYLEVLIPDTVGDPLSSDVWVKDGWVKAGEKPGHGMAIAAGALE